MDSVKITPLQAGMLLVTIIISTSIIFLPGAMARRDAWLAVLGGIFVGIITAMIIFMLNRLLPGLAPVEQAQAIFGPYAGKAIALVFIIFFVYLGALTLWDLGGFASLALLQGTPLAVTNAVSIGVALYAARHGLEVIARLNQLFLPFIVLSIVAALLLITGIPSLHVNITNLMPVLDQGIIPVLAGTVSTADWFGETLLLAVVLSRINSARYAGPLLWGLVLSGLLLTFIAVAVVAALGSSSPDLTFPFYSAVLLIEIARVIRLDMLFVTIWVSAVIIKLAFLLYIISVSASQLLRISNSKHLLSPVAVIIFGLSLVIISDTAEFVNINPSISVYAVTMQLLLPGLLLLVGYLRFRRKKLN